MRVTSWIAIACLTICSMALAEPPEIISVVPTFSRAEWLQRFRNPARRSATPDIRLHEKLELQIDLRATFDNPFDPDQIDLGAEFTAPSGKVWKIWGFYNPSRGMGQWMVRFTPTESGKWQYVIKACDQEGEAEGHAGEFAAVASEHPGFVTIAPNRRYLQYTDGSSFYGVGLWYNDSYENRDHGFITEEGLDQLDRRGVNFISFYPSLLETWATGLGRYDLDRAGRLDEIFDWCEERDIHISWNLVFHSNISEAVWGGGNARFRHNPYRSITSAKDYFASEEGWKYQAKLYRYIIARWGYSRSLFLWFAIDEINGTEGWTEGDRDAVYSWCRRINDFFNQHDPYGRPTTGTQSGGIGNWWPEGYQIFDIAGREIYEAQGHPMPHGGKPDLVNHHPLRYSYLNYAKQTQALWRGFFKPAIIAECGWDHTYYEPGTPGYLGMYHNALWGSLTNGACATPFWWSFSPRVNDSVVTGQVRSFAQFVSDIDFAGAEWEPIAVKTSHGDGWAMKSDKMVFGWVVNPTSGVANETCTISGLENEEYDVFLYRTWQGRYMDPVNLSADNGQLSITIPELIPQDGHANNIGDDVAFKIAKKGTYQSRTARRGQPKRP